MYGKGNLMIETLEHFTHKEGAVYFNKGETSKTVTVTELGVTNAYQSKAGTK